MARELHFVLNSNDLGQLLDGLEVRAKAWENTAEYFRTGESPTELFIIEECRDEEEARKLARHYRSIIETIERQVQDQLAATPES